jgi:hypothetical protein
MRSICLSMVLAFAATVAAGAETIVVRGPATVVVTAQDHALVLARRGTLVHSRCSMTEGIGCGATAEQARRNCCFFRDAMAGRRVIVDEGVAYSEAKRQWFAVIRYR